MTKEKGFENWSDEEFEKGEKVFQDTNGDYCTILKSDVYQSLQDKQPLKRIGEIEMYAPRKSVLISATRLYVDNQREFVFDMCDAYAVEWNEADNEVMIYHNSLPETLYIRADWEDIKSKFMESRT